MWALQEEPEKGNGRGVAHTQQGTSSPWDALTEWEQHLVRGDYDWQDVSIYASEFKYEWNLAALTGESGVGIHHLENGFRNFFTSHHSLDVLNASARLETRRQEATTPSSLPVILTPNPDP